MRRKLGHQDEDTLNDLTQECCVRLMRALRRAEARNLGALLTIIAQRTAIDFIRRRAFWSAFMVPLDEAEAERLAAEEPQSGAPPLPDHGDPRRSGPETFDRARPGSGAGEPGRGGEALETLRFEVLEFFALRESGCRELAAAFFREENWSSVARQSGLRPEAVRQRWSRCLKQLREAARQEHGSPLWLWARESPGSGSPQARQQPEGEES